MSFSFLICTHTHIHMKGFVGRVPLHVSVTCVLECPEMFLHVSLNVLVCVLECLCMCPYTVHGHHSRRDLSAFVFVLILTHTDIVLY